MTDKKLNIGLLIDTSLDGPDGVQQFVLTLGEELKSRGHKVKYLTGFASEDNPLAEDIYSLSSVVKAKINGNVVATPLPVSKKRVKEILAKEQFDIMHVTVPHSPLLASRVMRQAAKTMPIVGTFHIAVDTKIAAFGAKALALLQEPFSLRLFDYWTAASDVAADFGERYYGIKSDEVTYNPVDISGFKDAKPLNKHEGKTVVFLGRLVERKGANHLVEALQYLPEDTKKDLKVLIGGRGPLLEGLKKRVEELGLSSLVEFSGFVPEEDKASYLAQADICVFPSTGGECFGISLTEAMASGRSVVLGGDNRGYRNVLGEREELLFKPDDHEALASKLERFLSDEAAAKAAIDWQSDSVKQYDTAKLADQFERIYRSLI